MLNDIFILQWSNKLRKTITFHWILFDNVADDKFQFAQMLKESNEKREIESI